ncbi:MAG: Gfo/Idh/MocA family oxidoreductase [Candidatus Hydrogenedentes bacterium]|nr:Gfo/Idh/MocA family oxidoreductase [Candidatus Hydrogenedentota bacterium]
MKKHTISRRRFLVGAAAAGASCSLFPSRVLGANDRVNIGIIGLGGKGSAHLKDFGKIPNVEIVAVSDADKDHMDQAGEKVAKHQDLRRLLDMKDIDAVVIATPDHWHVLAAITAFQAGKHAYVEKPVSYSIWDGPPCRSVPETSSRVSTAKSCGCIAANSTRANPSARWTDRNNRRKPSTTTSGPAPRRCRRSCASSSITTGIGNGIGARAKWATGACTTSTTCDTCSAGTTCPATSWPPGTAGGTTTVKRRTCTCASWNTAARKSSSTELPHVRKWIH